MSKNSTTRGAIIFCMAMLAFVLWRSPNFGNFQSPSGAPFAGDFLQEWIGGHIVRTEGAEQLYDLPHVKEIQHNERLIGFQWAENSYFAMVYPPFYYVLVSPLSFVPYQLAAWIFTFAMIGCFFASVALLTSQTANCDIRARAIAFSLIAPLFFVPLIHSVTGGQKGTLCLLIFTATYVLLKSQRQYWSGIVFGLLVFKPQLAILIGLVMLLRGQWRFVAGSATTVVLASCLSLSLGVDVCWKYVEFCRGVGEYVHIGGYDLHKSHCIYGFLTLLAGGTATLPIKIAALVAIVLVVALTFNLSRKPTSSGEFDLQYAAMVIASLLVSPHLFTYDLSILLLPIYLIGVVYFQDESRPAKPVIGCLLCAMYIAPGFSEGIAATSGLQITTLVMLAMLCVIWTQLRNAANPLWLSTLRQANAT